MARGRIVIDLFTTLDGVAQAPGGPDEDPSGGFPYGGWQATFDDEIIGADVGAGIRRMDALVLGQGRKVFPEGTAPQQLRLIAPAVTGTAGILLLRYAPDGDVAAAETAAD